MIPEAPTFFLVMAAANEEIQHYDFNMKHNQLIFTFCPKAPLSKS